MSSYYNQNLNCSIEIKQAIAATGNINLFPDLNITKSTAINGTRKGPPIIVSKSPQGLKA